GRKEERDRGWGGAGRAFVEQTTELLSRPPQLPAVNQLLGDLEADVVAVAVVLGPRVAQADNQNALALLAAIAAAEQRQGLLALGLARVALGGLALALTLGGLA